MKQCILLLDTANLIFDYCERQKIEYKVDNVGTLITISMTSANWRLVCKDLDLYDYSQSQPEKSRVA